MTEMVAFPTSARIMRQPQSIHWRIANSRGSHHEDLRSYFAAHIGNRPSVLAQAAVKSIVLVHGAFADGSGWKPVADILERDGYCVYVAQIPETSFDADVAATKLVLDRSGPCVLVGP